MPACVARGCLECVTDPCLAALPEPGALGRLRLCRMLFLCDCWLAQQVKLSRGTSCLLRRRSRVLIHRRQRHPRSTSSSRLACSPPRALTSGLRHLCGKSCCLQATAQSHAP